MKTLLTSSAITQTNCWNINFSLVLLTIEIISTLPCLVHCWW